MTQIRRQLTLACSAIFSLTVSNVYALGGIDLATSSGNLGLYPASEFRITDGLCKDCAAPPAALWYFEKQTLAVPKAGAEGFARGLRAYEDVRANVRPGDGVAESRPPLLWLGASLRAKEARMTGDGKTLRLANGTSQAYTLVPKIEANRSYFDASSLAYFSGRQLDLRGEQVGREFVVRSLWPADTALDFSRMTEQPLREGESLDALLRADQGGARSPMSARLLWQRPGARTTEWAGRPVLAVVLNGAQGDDDEALGGHFAIATGRFGARGEWGDWIVNNFYNLDSVSEKGIIAASLPLDVYQGDLNSGQSWYRPSYLMVAVLRDPRAAAQFQQAISRVMNHFYRHDLTYHHANANCAGLSMETLRALGWEIPRQGPTNRLKAVAALPVVSVQDRSLESGIKAVDYLMAERTSLYPMTAFQAASQDLLTRVAAGKVSTAYEQQLSADLEGLVLIRLPQFPSSRAFGSAPVASIDEYIATAPANRADWKIVPVPPRPFPEALRDPASPAPEMSAGNWTLAGYGGILGLGSLGAWQRRKKKRQQKNHQSGAKP